MAELIPIIGGSVTGVLCARFAAGRARWVVIGLVGLALAAIAVTVSGESPWFLLWDFAQAVGAAALAALVYARIRASRRHEADA